MGDFPTGDPNCPDCKGTGTYQGLGKREPCGTCSKKAGSNADLSDALEFVDLVEELFPETSEEPRDPVDPKWASESRVFPEVYVSTTSELEKLLDRMMEMQRGQARKWAKIQYEAFYDTTL